MSLKYDLIALDVDGTLLRDDHVLTDGIRDSVREAASRGAQIVLCTGRGPSGAIPVLEQLGLGGTVITHNGAATINADDRSVVHQFDMVPDHLLDFIHYCREHGIHYDLNTAFEMMVENMTPEAESMYVHYQAKPSIWNFHDGLPTGLVKFTVFGNKEKMDMVQAEWAGWPPLLKSIRSGDFFIDVHHAEANKGRALQQLAEIRGIAPSRILAIGNYYNDITMLQYAGMGIAMGNSPEKVKQAANAVALSNSEDGVAAALREYAWS
ncbi:Cof-type HAD-IIB family hydrolase [Paenibacillus alkaliterrae]|uniref:Cof-type HAD-IIB family hydrolase n=1 Tax=Paenibacillus alkaliterrae TaxID=320909 RepID=UPI001F2644F7|nr:Cof-type HAD-IIB family hydrolase [Paenibacillus alkaliterrae]MCF2938815.1 Cof-type HAD-IIB family hydrolase [Paenibacillus alkaliterrae]